MAGPVWAATYVVDQTAPGAADTNPGTEAQPFKTVQHAADAAQPGDTIYVMAGQYDERVRVKVSGTEGRPVVFVARPRHSATVRGFDLGASHIRVEGFEITADRPTTAVQLRGSHCDILDNFIHHMMTAVNGTDGELSAHRSTRDSADDMVTMENAIDPGPIRGDEPFIKTFSFSAAVRYMDETALTWQTQRKCFACHCGYAFLIARPAVSHEAPAHATVRLALEHLAENPQQTDNWVTEAVMVASTLARNDAATTRKLHPSTRKALDRIWTAQREDGGWTWIKNNEPPSEVDDHYGVTMAAIGVGMAPDGYSKTPAAREGLEKIRQYLRSHPPANMHQRAMVLLASVRVDGIMTDAERREAVEGLLSLQKPDGGWGLATLGHWTRSDGKAQDYESSDGYGTGFVIYVLRCAGITAEDPRIRKGIAWLKTHQRASGRWFTRSMTRDNTHLITNSGTAYGILALALCGEFESLDEIRQ